MRRARTAFYLTTGAASLAYFLSPWGDSVFYPLVAFATALACLGAARRSPQAAGAWYALAAGALLWAIGDSIYVVIAGESWTAPFPSPADVSYALGYAAFVAAAGILVRVHLARRRFPAGGILELAVLLLGAAVVVWELVLEPVNRGASLESVVATGYPALDAIVAATLLQLYVWTSPRARPLGLLAAGFGVTMVADVAYARELLSGWGIGDAVLDLLWIGGYVLLGAAALAARGAPAGAAADERPAIRARGLLLVAAMVVPLILLSVDPADVELLVGAAVMWSLAVARLGYLVSENGRLADASAHDASLIRATLDATEDALLATDLELRPTAHNRQFRELWQAPPELLAGGRLDDLLAHMAALVAEPAVTARSPRLLLQEDGGGLAEFELVDGRRVQRAGRAQLLGGGVVGRVWSFRDVTRERAAERALRESSRRLREIFENARLLVVTLDPDLRIVHCNGHFLEVTGWKRRRLVGRLWHEAMLPDEDAVELALSSNERHHAGAVAEHHVNAILTRRGERRLISWNSAAVHDLEGRLANLTLIGFDVTDQARVEVELRRQERRSRALLENSYELMLVLDGAGRIVEDSAVRTNVLGYSAGALVGTRLEEIVDPADAPRLRELQELATASPGKSVPFEWRFLDRRRQTRVLAGFGTNLLDDPDIGGIVVNARDVTGARAAEEALQASREQLLHAQKLEAVARLAGGVAHDFNNLLTAIRGYSELLLLQLEPDHPARVDATEIGAAAGRAAALTRQLLAFSRRQVLRPVVLQPNEIVGEMENLLRRLIGEDVTLETDLDDELALVRADPSQLEQVLANLVVNARDAMPDGGTIHVSTRNVPADAPDGPGVVLSVSDTGCGMDEDTRERAFEPFFTTKEQGRGTGLGLATVHGIVTQSGGRVVIDSAPGAGTRVEVVLPCAEGAAFVEEGEDGHPEAGSETILLVEDEALVRDLARRILAGHGYHVLEAPDSPAAVDLCESYGGRIDLLLTDVVMPRLSGPDLAERLLTIRPELQVLFMSGYAAPEVLRRGLVDAESAFLPKPFTPDILAAKVREVLDAARV